MEDGGLSLKSKTSGGGGGLWFERGMVNDVRFRLKRFQVRCVTCMFA